MQKNRYTAAHILFANVKRRLTAEAREIITELGREEYTRKLKKEMAVCYINVPPLIFFV